MSEPLPFETSVDHDRGSNTDPLSLEVAILAGRLAGYLRRALPEGVGLEPTLAFLESRYRATAGERPVETWLEDRDRRSTTVRGPFDRLISGLELADAEIDLLLLAALPEEHEGFADLLRGLHPENRPYASVGLAAQLLCGDDRERLALRGLLETGQLVRSGALALTGDAPFFGRSLQLAEALWPVLRGIDAWPKELAPCRDRVISSGLEDWLAEAPVRRAGRVLSSFQAMTIVISADEEEVAYRRGLALAESAGTCAVGLELSTSQPVSTSLIGLHCLIRRQVPVLLMRSVESAGPVDLPAFSHYPGPVVLAARDASTASSTRPVLPLTCNRLRPSSLVRMWQRVLPDMADQAAVLAARYPLEPHAAQRVAAELERLSGEEGKRPLLEDVAASVRSWTGASIQAGIQRRRPTAAWESLILPEPHLEQLREAVDRLHQQVRVLDQWRFLEGRTGARGVRMLFTGPPGTGKTLSAEVLAHALGVDLLVVDLSRVVSKWIGETEKNLARVFEVAEQSRAVLLFDEADALFGKRTEVSDAHDRYANLETAYLLTRLERFEGLAILSTNLRQNIDEAFTRRLEFIVDYREPNRQERLGLWRCHLPATAPVAEDVDLEELAACYPLVGGMIRNAAVAAGFLAASDGTAIERRHFIRAIRREYEKSGKAFPGDPNARLRARV